MKTDRTLPPPFSIPETVRVIHPVTCQAANGVPIHILDIPRSEVTRVSLVFRAGTGLQDKPFLASAALNLINEGSGKYSARDISELIDFYGAHLDYSIDRDYAVISLCTLEKFLRPLSELFSDMMTDPSFPEHELEVYRNKRKQHLRIEREKVSYRSRELFGESLFGTDNPYGRFYPIERYDDLTVADLHAHFSRYYTAGNCFVVASGHLSDELVSVVKALAGRLRPGERIEFPELPRVRSVPYREERWKGALQSAIRIGKVMFPRNHPDFIGMQVLMMVLGGYFGSRLMTNLRENKGYAYGVYASMINMELSGYLAVATEVAAEHTASAVDQIRAEIRRLRDEPVTEHELSMVKNMITGEFMHILDGPFGITDVTIENLQNGNTNEYIEKYVREVKEITSERLHELAVNYLGEEDWVTVVVGQP